MDRHPAPRPVSGPRPAGGARPFPLRHAAPRLLTALLALVLGGCTLVNSPGAGPSPGTEPAERPEAVAREFGGQLSLGGSTLPVLLSLVIRGEEVEEALLAVPELSMEARGDGHLRDGRLVLELEYGDGCRGTARVAGDVEERGGGFQGILSAKDCTGSEEGALVLHLRSGSGSPQGPRPLLVESAPPGA